jgi:hypothetical protein
MTNFTSSKWENGYKVYSFYGDVLEIGYLYLFEILKKKYDTNVSVYIEHQNSFVMHCEYPIEKLNNIKKFFYDTYPAVETVKPENNSIVVTFKLKPYIIKL